MIKTVKILFLASAYLLISYTISAANSPSASQLFAADDDLKQLVVDWNEAHVTKDVDVFSNLFDRSVLFYGTPMDKDKCIKSKRFLFKKYPDFHQQIFGDIRVDSLFDGSVKCSFVKRVTVNRETKDYPSYLVFKKAGDDWKIITEGDLVTDEILAKKDAASIPEGAVEGDYDGDGKTEYVWLVAPKLPQEGGEDNFGACEGECECYLKFSNHKIPSVKIADCIGGTPVNEGDLNDDGADEIGLLPDWWTSCWRGYQVFTFRANNWKYAVKPFTTHCNQWDEKDFDPIKKDDSKKGYVIIQYADFSDEGPVTLHKSIPVEK